MRGETGDSGREDDRDIEWTVNSFSRQSGQVEGRPVPAFDPAENALDLAVRIEKATRSVNNYCRIHVAVFQVCDPFYVKTIINIVQHISLIESAVCYIC